MTSSIPLRILKAKPITSEIKTVWPSDNTPYQNNPFRWEVTLQVTSQSHSSPLTPIPYSYDARSIQVGDWFSNTTNGIAWRIVGMSNITPVSLTCILEDVDQYNTYVDPGVTGDGGIPLNIDGFVFQLDKNGFPILQGMTSNILTTNWQSDIQSRFSSANDPAIRTLPVASSTISGIIKIGGSFDISNDGSLDLKSTFLDTQGGIMQGPLSLQEPVLPEHAARKADIDDIRNLVGSTSETIQNMSTDLETLENEIQTSNSEIRNDISSVEETISSIETSLADKLSLQGGNMTGSLILSGDATLPLQAVTKNQLDAATMRAKRMSGPRTRLRMGSIGDSKIANGTNITTSSSYLNSIGVQTWLGFLSKQRVEHRPEWNLAVAGYQSDQILPLAQSALSLPIDILLIEGGTNDLTANVPLDTLIANMKSAIDLALNAGLFVVAMPIPPRTFNSSADLQTKLARYNFWLKNYNPNTSGFFVADIFKYAANNLAEPSSSLNLGDGLHQTSTGARLYSLAVLEAIQPILGNCEPWLINNPNDLASSTVRVGNLISNGMLSGTAGSKSGGVTGNVATGWLMTTTVPANTGTIVANTVERSGSGGWWQEIAISNRSGVNEGIFLNQVIPFSSGLYQPGDKLIARCEVEVDSGSVNLSGPYIRVTESAGGSSTAYDVRGFNHLGSAPGPSVSYTGVIETPIMTVRSPDTTSGTQQISFSFGASLSCATGDVTGTLRFGRMSFFKIN